MKKMIVVIMALAMLVFGATAAMADNVGCGIGSEIFKGKMDTTLFQILAVTTNGILGNQTFGITFGTVGCSQPSSFASSERLNQFVASNMDAIAQDIARGQGESLDTVAELMGVEAGQRAQFASTLQSGFSSIFTSADVTSAEVIDNIAKVASLS